MHATYLNPVFDRKQQDKKIREMMRILKDGDITFDGFLVTGISGISIGAIMARSMRKELVVIRKGVYSDHHSGYSIENLGRGKSYIFLDDLVATGETVTRCKDAIDQFVEDYAWGKEDKPKIIGQLLYNHILQYRRGNPTKDSRMFQYNENQLVKTEI